VTTVRNTAELRAALANLAQRAISTKDAGYYLSVETTADADAVHAERSRVLTLLDALAPTLAANVREMVAAGVTYSPAASAGKAGASAPVTGDRKQLGNIDAEALYAARKAATTPAGEEAE
jgi:hypothetical protein